MEILSIWILIAQAQSESLRLVTRDPLMKPYDVEVVWALILFLGEKKWVELSVESNRGGKGLEDGATVEDLKPLTSTVSSGALPLS